MLAVQIEDNLYERLRSVNLPLSEIIRNIITSRLDREVNGAVTKVKFFVSPEHDRLMEEAAKKRGMSKRRWIRAILWDALLEKVPKDADFTVPLPECEGAVTTSKKPKRRKGK